LRKSIEQNMPTLDKHNQQRLQKMVNAAEKFVSARDLLHQECSDKFKQANESDARASIRSIVVGKGKIMSFEDIEEAQAKREKKEVAQARRRERKGNKSTSGPVSRKSATIVGQGTIPEPSTPHIGKGVALVALTATLVYI
jgi:hypothetical protein